MMILVSVVLLILIWWLINRRYVGKGYITPMNESDFGKLFKTLYHKYYVDEIYQAIIVKPLYWLSDVFYKIVDLKIVDGIVNLTGKGVDWGSRTVRLAQTGSVGFYIFAMVVGIIVMLAFNLIK
jgi:NADH-quinone oxidoreductase subunit L